VELVHGVVVPGLHHGHRLVDHAHDELRQVALRDGEAQLLDGEDHRLRLPQSRRRLELGCELELVEEPRGHRTRGHAAAHAPSDELQGLRVVRRPLGLPLDQLPVALGREVAPPRAQPLQHERPLPPHGPPRARPPARR
jgi:hypothetical protein